METKNYYIKKIMKTLAWAIIGGIAIPTMFDMNHDIYSAIMNFVLFAGVPSGWVLLTKLLGSWVTLNPLSMLMILFAKLCGSIFVGWVALPVTLIMDIVKMTKAPAQQEEMVYGYN